MKLVVTESVEGYLDHQGQIQQYYRLQALDPHRSRKEWAIPSSGVPLRIREPWFDGDSGEPWQVRHQVADALKAHLAYRRSVALADIRTAVDNVFVQTSKGYLLSNNSVLVYDNVCGGLGLTVKGGGKLGQRGAECQSVNSSTWSNLPPPITIGASSPPIVTFSIIRCPTQGEGLSPWVARAGFEPAISALRGRCPGDRREEVTGRARNPTRNVSGTMASVVTPADVVGSGIGCIPWGTSGSLAAYHAS